MPIAVHIGTGLAYLDGVAHYGMAARIDLGRQMGLLEQLYNRRTEHLKPTRDDVVWGYKYILGRAPESEYAIQAHLSAASLKGLIQGLIDSDEFRGRVSKAVPTVTSMQVQSRCSAGEMEQLRRRVTQTWEQLGQEAPHFSVLTSEEYLPDEFKNNEEAFWRSGAVDADDLRASCERNYPDFSYSGMCVELGCGVGRVSYYLSKMFDRVLALDISEPHLEVARAHARELGVSNIDFVNVSDGLSGAVDVAMFFSRIVLQHSSPPLIRSALEQMLSLVRSGGAAMFQVPTFMDGYSFDVTEYLSSKATGLEMHCLPQQEIFELLAAANFQPREVRQTDDVGRTADWVSNTFFAVKA